MPARIVNPAVMGARVHDLHGWYAERANPCLLESPALGVLYAFDQEALVLVTRAGLGRLGATGLQDLSSYQLGDLFHAEDLPRVTRGFLRTPSSPRRPPCEMRLIRTDGGLIDVWAEYVELGRDGQALLVCHAPGPLLEASAGIGSADAGGSPEAGMRHLERLATLGTVAAGVVHEINNPLAYALLSLEQLALSAQKLSEDAGDLTESVAMAKLLDHVADAREAIENAAELIKAVRSLGRGQSRPVGAVPLREVLEHALRLTAHDLRKRVRVVIDVESSPLVAACKAELDQVFVNLLINAAQAVPLARTDGEVRISVGAEPPWVVVEVRDNGVGIAPGDLPHVFDPFFTTKDDGLGTGLGLSITRAIVSGLGGSIRVMSRPGEGSTFRLELPACEPDGSPSVPPASSRVRASVRRRRG